MKERNDLDSYQDTVMAEPSSEPDPDACRDDFDPVDMRSQTIRTPSELVVETLRALHPELTHRHVPQRYRSGQTFIGMGGYEMDTTIYKCALCGVVL